jgi:tryptophan-rich sensory protein
MTTGYAVLISICSCLAAAATEGICAGKNVKSFYATLRFPPYSAPLWLWSVIGGVYYLIFWFVLYRLLRLDTGSFLKPVALALIALMMLANALTNYVIFRARDLYLTFVIGSLFPIFDTVLFVILLMLDRITALTLIPYLVYRVYAVWWGFGLWRINRGEAAPFPK